MGDGTSRVYLLDGGLRDVLEAVATLAAGAAVTDPLRVRRLREQLAAVSQYVTDLHMPIHEGYRFAPLIVEDCFDSLSGILHEFDLQLAKIDGGSAVGGEMTLREEWREQP